MPRSLEELHKVLLELTLILLHVITYGFIIWSVLCHHGIIDCHDRVPAACACHAFEKHLSVKKPVRKSLPRTKGRCIPQHRRKPVHPRLRSGLIWAERPA
ncbi:MAG: hypothetical protein M3Z32_07025 [Acidobacteriota bacterium]|nr:hypothetical protein [Acidobacteriota bacterium]